MPRIHREVENDDGWSDWIHPLDGYRLACCDCGLVHNMEFRTDDLGRINFRASRNNRSTGQMRRHERIRKSGQNTEFSFDARPPPAIGLNRAISEAARRVLANPDNSKKNKISRVKGLTQRG